MHEKSSFGGDLCAFYDFYLVLRQWRRRGGGRPGGTETSELTGENHAAGGPDAKTETLAQSNGAGSGGSDEATGPYAVFESLDLTESLLPAIFLPVAS